jgi:hypothetical protein
MSSDPTGWHVYRGTGDAAPSPIAGLPEPPPWPRPTGTGTSPLAGLAHDAIGRARAAASREEGASGVDDHLGTGFPGRGAHQDRNELLTAGRHPLSAEVG